MKKTLALFLSIVLVLSFSGMAFAGTTNNPVNGKPTLVALGDSITTGYGIDNIGDAVWEANPKYKSKGVYPQLIGYELGYNVRNLAVSGWTSGDLLNALENNNQYRVMVKKADLITLNIGGNDVLGYLKEVDFSDPELELLTILGEIEERLITYYLNLGFILDEIRSLNSDAPILYYGFYNPIDKSHPFSVAFGYDSFNYLVAGINNAILFEYDAGFLANMFGESYADAFADIYYVDALTAIEMYVGYGGEKADLFIDQVHLSSLGHEIMYEASLVALDQIFTFNQLANQ